MQKIWIVYLLLFSSVLLALPQHVAAGPVYRWTDESGTVHYGDLAPEGVEATRVDINPNTVTVVSPEKSATSIPGISEDDGSKPEASGDQPELSYAEQRRQDRATRRLENAEIARKQKINCDLMQQQKSAVQSVPRLLVDDGNGGVRRLEYTERAQLLSESNAFLAENCLP